MTKFKISEKYYKGLKVIELVNRTNGEYFNIIPQYGGAINEIVFNHDGELRSIHKCAKSLEEFMDVSMPLYSGAFLAPFPNRIRDGKYTFQGEEYQLKINETALNNTLHGFSQEFNFSMISADMDSGLITLGCDFPGTKGYPFSLFFRNTYQLLPGQLKISTYIQNKSNQEIPIGIGWHPYIDLGTNINELLLSIPGHQVFEQDHRYLPTGRTTTTDKFRHFSTISDLFLNDCYLMQGNTTFLKDPQSGLEIFLKQKTGLTGYNYCMFYTPPLRNCIAIEPMTCAPDAFNNGHGTIVFPKNESLSFEFSIGVNHQ